MAKWLKDYLSFGSRRSPPQPPKPDYTESDILKAYRAQKSLDFEDPYEEGDSGKLDEVPREEVTPSVGLEGKYGSPKHRLIKVEASDLNRSKALLTADEGLTQPEQNESQQAFDPQRILQLLSCSKDPPIETPGESEYSDPFDAHRELKEDLEEDAGSEDNGYMEPYDAQKVVVDFQSKTNWDDQGAKKSRIDLQLYDTPYEEKEMEADAEGPSAEMSRESRLPQNDERPADEYDQPWEWKKNHISRAFAVDIKESKVLPWPPPVGELTGSEEGLDPEVQFDNPDWELTSSASSAHKEHWRQHLTTPPSKFGRPQSPEHSLLVAEHVDPSVPLEKQAWFHGTISRADAESLLTLCKEGSYLVRNSETSRNDYSLSLRSSQGFMHMKFTQTKESKYILGQNSAPFDSIPEVIHHYATQELPIKGAENLSLLYPVAIQTL